MDNNKNQDEWSNRNWQSVNNPQTGFGRSAFGFGQDNNNNEEQGSLLGNLFNAGSSGKVGGGWMQGRNSVTVIIVVLVIIVIYTFYTQVKMDANITKSTIERTKIESVDFNAGEDPFYMDEYGVVEDERSLANAAEYFHDKTGVIPFVYFSTTDVVPSEAEVSDKANAFYAENITDEDHFVVYLETFQEGAVMGTSVGENAKAVLDAEALQIFKDYFNKFYMDRQTNNQMYMVNTYRYASDRMMTTLPYTPKNLVIGGIAIVILIAVVVYYIKKKDKDAEKAKEEQL